MVVNLKNIIFKYVKIVSGVSSIDTDMTDEKFFTTKPTGYYRCFIFPKIKFSGVWYSDLKNLVATEESEMWDRINRDTFMGYNEATNSFICNINAYMGLKDSDLKVFGESPHPGMAGWYEMDLTSDYSDGIISLLQTDISDIYLKIKRHAYGANPNGNFTSSGNICVENTKKKVAERPIFIKEDALWCKSSDDNSTLMVQNNIPQNNMGAESVIYRNSNRVAFHSTANNYYQSFMYGKPCIYFPDATSNTIPISINSLYKDSFFIKNNTGKDHVEYTETSDLNNVLNSNEYLVFQQELKSKYIFACKQSGTPNDILGKRNYYPVPLVNFYNKPSLSVFSEYFGSSLEGLSCNLISLDPKDKPFLYNAPERDILIHGISDNIIKSKVGDISNIPDGFIFLVLGIQTGGSTRYIVRYKNGEEPKAKQISQRGYFIKISEATGFGDNLFFGTGDSTASDTVSKNDIINATGFSDIDKTLILRTPNDSGLNTITVYKI